MTQIPQPVRYDLYPGMYVCSVCECWWMSDYNQPGEPNTVIEACSIGRCRCHSVEWMTALYEGAVA